jgi:glucose-1-phosphate adenylyltransferase
MGIYLFRTDALASLLEENDGSDLCRHILPTAIASRPVYAYPYEGYWEDLGTLRAFYQANLALTWPNPPFDFYDPQCPVYTRSRFLPPSRMDGCRLERTVVANGCRLSGADLEECVIGLRSVVRPGTRLRQVVMMGADSYESAEQETENRRLGRPSVGIGHGTSIERAIIDRNARIGQGVLIDSHEGEQDCEEELYAVRDGIVVIPKNAVIPDGTTLYARVRDWERQVCYA